MSATNANSAVEYSYHKAHIFFSFDYYNPVKNQSTPVFYLGSGRNYYQQN
ncbi:MAG TPA: hypothetical protein PLU85_05435 [Bacteroidia bacterium]|nr:hypothetical protein [Bacteroidia bacterium]HOZ91569.1 hypothetical protein [Bacteroidia bacterium]HQW17055.1 hypothetical protein [Bacteroidia bacterium]HQW48456.1 hypothetical protein [Bacteroidia bacterium]HQX69371.1 hypothetical protein [Bacteroidia bacterium]